CVGHRRGANPRDRVRVELDLERRAEPRDGCFAVAPRQRRFEPEVRGAREHQDGAREHKDAPFDPIDSHLFSAYLLGKERRMPLDGNQYQPGEFFDELFVAPGKARPAASQLANYLASLGQRELADRQGDAERAIAEMGITFTVYTEGQNIDRAWPFDVIP